MRILQIILKSLKEQLRSYWILLLTVLMAPFFVFIYYLIIESSEVRYDILILNNDNTINYENNEINFGDVLIKYFNELYEYDGIDIPLSINIIEDKVSGVKNVKTHKSDVFLIIPSDFSREIINNSNDIEIEFIGDLTDVNYMISAVWTYDIVSSFLSEVTDIQPQFEMKEIGVGSSGKVDDFQYSVPGLLILSIIMLMFSASMAIISEVENKTILRLKLSKLEAWEFLSGVGAVQVVIGIIAIYITLATAVAMGFELKGSLGIFSLIAILTSISIVAFSLIIAAFTKSANEILIVGNFPLFLFMFFTGAAFPISAKAIFKIFGYPVNLQSLMSPTHAISALKKIMIMDMNFADILPEVNAIIIITIIYFIIGIWLFNRKHMRIV